MDPPCHQWMIIHGWMRCSEILEALHLTPLESVKHPCEMICICPSTLAVGVLEHLNLAHWGQGALAPAPAARARISGTSQWQIINATKNMLPFVALDPVSCFVMLCLVPFSSTRILQFRRATLSCLMFCCRWTLPLATSKCHRRCRTKDKSIQPASVLALQTCTFVCAQFLLKVICICIPCTSRS